MTMNVNYWSTPPRARAGMAYGQYNQIAPYATSASGVTSGCIVSLNTTTGMVNDGGSAPAGVVVDSEAVLGMGFDDQYVNATCSVLEQGKVWIKTLENATLTAGSAVKYDSETGILNPAGTSTVEGWTVLEATNIVCGATLCQILPLRSLVKTTEEQVEGTQTLQSVEAPEATELEVTEPQATKNKKDKDQA